MRRRFSSVGPHKWLMRVLLLGENMWRIIKRIIL
jgi:hypothetical protein